MTYPSPTTDPTRSARLAVSKRRHKATLLRDHLRRCDALRGCHAGRGAGFVGLMSAEEYTRARDDLVARIEKLES